MWNQRAWSLRIFDLMQNLAAKTFQIPNIHAEIKKCKL